ncbi:MAG TPA: PocR ligand-binding domain-containing protein [Opitutales bacterium]|nr:PocR ligand-binding domain-containing protein [Opitutales bacterium]
MKKTPLEIFLEEVKRLSGMEVCIYDLNFFLNDSPKLTVPSQLLIHNCAYCHFVKSDPAAFARCIETENWRTERAAEIDGPLIHTCHAGVTDMILPVKVQGKQIGAAFIGQVFTQKEAEVERTLEELRKRYGFEKQALKKAARSVPRVSSRKLRRVKPLLGAITDYLEQAEELAVLQRERDFWAKGRIAYEAMPTGEVKVEEIPTPTLDRIQVALTDSGHPSVRKAIRLIKKSYWMNPTAECVSKEVGMSESHFSREFRKAAGTTYRQCLLEARLNAAFYLIKRNSYTIEEAAAVVGYENGCSLQRAFKMFTGLTPRQFIRRYPRAFMLEKFASVSAYEMQQPEKAGNAMTLGR